MNEEKVTRETTETWRWTDWGKIGEYVAVYPPGSAAERSVNLRHESEIREHWPEKVRVRIRAEILAHRPEGDDERRAADGELIRFRVNGAELGAERIYPPGGHWYPIDRWSPAIQARAEAWFEKNKPAPKLEANQFMVGNMTRTVRWHDGQPQSKLDDTGWCPWWFAIKDCEKEDAWFRANCPADRFVMDDGRVHCFEMRDDGEAECREVCAITIDGGPSAGCKSQALLALYRFRDAERAKWEFELNKEELKVRHDGNYRGYLDDDGPSPDLQTQPTWVRTRAEKMWRERETKWTTEWSEANAHTRIFHNSIQLGHYGNRGLIRLAGPEIPPHILAEARAKFRENYVLKADEAWMGDSVVVMEWETESSDGPRVVIGNLWFGPLMRPDSWTKGASYWKTDSERLEAFDRCKDMFRANYALKPNEIWKRGEVVKLRWDAKFARVGFLGTVDYGSGAECFWDKSMDDGRWLEDETWTDEAERLAAYDRCRAFYYENVDDAVLLDGVVLKFEMRGDVGYASGEGGYECWLKSTVESSSALPARKKLRAWTDKQLAARKVTFEAFTVRWENEQDKNRDNLVSHKVSFVCDHEGSVNFEKAVRDWRKVRFTIEPAGEP